MLNYGADGQGCLLVIYPIRQTTFRFFIYWLRKQGKGYKTNPPCLETTKKIIIFRQFCIEEIRERDPSGNCLAETCLLVRVQLCSVPQPAKRLLQTRCRGGGGLMPHVHSWTVSNWNWCTWPYHQTSEWSWRAAFSCSGSIASYDWYNIKLL